MKVLILVIASISVLSAAQNPGKCNPATPNIYEYFGTNLICPKGLLCNSRSLTTKPCVPVKEICNYSCNKGNVVINDVTFQCDSNQECNEAQTSCEVCVNKPCDKNAWKCKNDDTGNFYLGNAKYACPSTTVCNKHYKFPCQPCYSESADQPVKTRKIYEQSFFD